MDMTGNFYGGGLAKVGQGFDIVAFFQRRTVILRAVCWVTIFLYHFIEIDFLLVPIFLDMIRIRIIQCPFHHNFLKILLIFLE
jgi:hypothetical protein